MKRREFLRTAAFGGLAAAVLPLALNAREGIESPSSVLLANPELQPDASDDVCDDVWELITAEEQLADAALSEEAKQDVRAFMPTYLLPDAYRISMPTTLVSYKHRKTKEVWMHTSCLVVSDLAVAIVIPPNHVVFLSGMAGVQRHGYYPKTRGKEWLRI